MDFTSFDFAKTFLFVILLYFITCECYRFIKTLKFRYPPGPIGLPFVGYLPFLGKLPYETLRNLSKKYGNIISLKIGGANVVVLNDYEAVKEAFSNPHILDRPSGVFDFHAGGLGVTSTSGLKWAEERRLIARILKDIGVGKEKWETSLDNEIDIFTEILFKWDGQPLDAEDVLSKNIANNSLNLVLGKTLPRDDPTLQMVVRAVDAISPVLNQSSAANFIPAVGWILAKLGLSKLDIELKNLEWLNTFFKKEMSERKKNQMDYENTFIDEYRKKMQEYNESNTICKFSEYDLIGSAQSIIHGGTETVRTSILWLFLAMAAHPDIQRKVHEEISSVLGKMDRCQWSDRKRMPYTYATVMEGQRWKTAIPLGLAHRAEMDTTINGYDIPKDTFVISNIWAVHNDPKYWKNPEEFIPDRFLTEDSTLPTIKPESFIPLSYGRRICPGELIAWVELFRFFTTTIQKFEILALEDASPNLEGIIGATYQPHRQKLRFIART